MSDLPPGWVKKISSRTGMCKKTWKDFFELLNNLGKEYYIDPVTKESQWEHPSSTSNKPSSGRKGGNGDQVQVLHILVKHTGSRNPKNYKGETITRSKEDARKRLNGLFSFFF